jgi:Reverse transcriptase (RNA-dependent DNA polymerase)
MTLGLMKSCKKKSKLYLKYIKNPTEKNKSIFVSYRNKFKAIRLQAEKNFYAAEFCKHSNNLRKTWDLLRTLIGRDNNLDTNISSLNINGTKSSDPQAIANKFNNYFTGIAESLAQKIPNSSTSFEEYMGPVQTDSFGLNETSPEEIIAIGRSIRPSHAKGVDDIDPTIALPSLPSIACPLAELINCSFKTGIFPGALKIAKVVPIFKSGARDEVSNYRPISVLPFFSKFFEKTMYERLNNFITKTKALFPSQHGFQSGHSSYMPLLSMQDKISEAFDNNEYSIGIFFDLAKAFDTINHNILIKKLSVYGIRSTQLKWFADYLENRSQLVSCNGASSLLSLIKYGVPQGSILGPLLFILYINDLPNVSSILMFILFADDSNVFYSHSSLDALIHQTNTELQRVAEWFSANKLTLNLNKTNYILFRSYKKSLPLNYPKVCIMDTQLTQVYTTKFLGVYVDQHLSWKEHIYNISNKIAKNLGILSRTASVIPPSIRKTLYNTLIYPYLTYCNIVWASAYKSNLMKLIVPQKRAVRYVASARYWAHTEEIFRDFKILRIDQIRQYQIGIFMYRYDHGLLPISFQHFFTLIRHIHRYNTRSRNLGLYHLPKARTNSRLYSIRSAGARQWNAIPLAIRLLPNLQLFKRRLRTHILDK